MVAPSRASTIAFDFTAATDRQANSRRIGEVIAKTMAQLSLQERTAFTLRHYEGMAIEAISRELGLSENATKQSIFRAVQKLRRVLGPWVGVVVITLWNM